MQLVNFSTFNLPKQGLIVIIILEHIGDIIACEPIIGFAKRNWPNTPVAWITLSKYTELLEMHPDLDYLLIADSLVHATRWAESLPENCKTINLHFHRRPCPVTGIMVDNGNNSLIDKNNYYDHGSLLSALSLCAGIPHLADPPHFYLGDQASFSRPSLPYAVFHCLSNDSNRDWAPEKWLQLFHYFADQGLKVVEVGLKPLINSSSPKYQDMTGCRSFQQIGLLIRNADFFVGIDSGFAHMANALETDGLVIMGAYGKWSRHVPFTGLYAEGHIVRHPLLPARYLPVGKVIDRYEEIKSLKPTNFNEEILPDSRNQVPNFPNKWQKVVLKIYRPLAKRGPEHEYQLFKANPRLYFMIPGKEKMCKKMVRTVLKLTGGVPPQVV